MKRMIARIGSLWRDSSGVTAVEFALISVPFFVLIVGGMDLAHMAYARSVLQGALNDTARRASVEDPQFTASGATLEERVKATIKAQVGYVAPKSTYQFKTRNYFDFSGIDNPEKLMTDNNGNGRYDSADNDCFEDLNGDGGYDTDAGRSGQGGANDVVFYEVTMTMPRLFNIGLLGSKSTHAITAETAVRNQPYGTQATPAVICGA